MGLPLRVLIIEDSEGDAQLLAHELQQGGYEPTFERACTAEAMSALLDQQQWNIVIADYVMPRFSGLDALKLLHQRGIDVPFIIVSGNIGWDTAVAVMKAGAHDYIMKGNLTRLVPAVRRELREAEERQKRRDAAELLRRSHAELESRVEDRTVELVATNERLKAEIAERKQSEQEREKLVAQLRVINERLVVSALAAQQAAEKEYSAQEELRKAQSELEARVRQRTAELAQANERLRLEVAERRLADEQLTQSYEKLRRTISATVQAMAMTVEMRDPYTSGHERRVAKLAVAIAREMGLSETLIDGIDMAAEIHDIGKIYVPTEYLSKPGRLTEIELTLIKAHAQVGYDILKEIEFPWPIAEIVRQHHERIDGSGYPCALKGDGILLEARIIGVADTVEAMASHRPYRPALGVERAMEEISHNSGKLYDPGVTQACTKVFSGLGLWE